MFWHRVHVGTGFMEFEAGELSSCVISSGAHCAVFTFYNVYVGSNPQIEMDLWNQTAALWKIKQSPQFFSFPISIFPKRYCALCSRKPQFQRIQRNASPAFLHHSDGIRFFFSCSFIGSSSTLLLSLFCDRIFLFSQVAEGLTAETHCIHAALWMKDDCQKFIRQKSIKPFLSFSSNQLRNQKQKSEEEIVKQKISYIEKDECTKMHRYCDIVFAASTHERKKRQRRALLLFDVRQGKK